MRSPIKLLELTPEPNKAFDLCKLNREQYAPVLENIVRTFGNGFVMAIDGKWGTGKTTFVRMWGQYLIENSFKVAHLNAWENDLDEKALPVILAEFKSLLEKENKNSEKAYKIFDELINKGSVIAKNALPALLKSQLKRYGVDEDIIEGIQKGTEGLSDELEKDLKEYVKRKKGIVEFKKKLEEFISTIKGEQPVVFIIDELDRCRPDYAVQILETIKHFFSIPGIVFVLSIDKVQLGHAIRGVYGSEKIDADEYLRRFIDINFSLPEPDRIIYCNYLAEYFQWSAIMELQSRDQRNGVYLDIENILVIASTLVEHKKLTLRQIEKLFAYTTIVLSTFSKQEVFFVDAIFFLIYCKHYHEEFYNTFKDQRVDINYLPKEFQKTLSENIFVGYRKDFLKVEASIFCLYAYSFSSDVRARLIVNDGNSYRSFVEPGLLETTHTFGSEIHSFLQKNELLSGRFVRELLDKIELLQGFNV